MDIEKDGDGPTAGEVHVASIDWRAGLRNARRAKKRSKVLAKAQGRWPGGAPGSKGGQFAPSMGGGGGGGSTPWWKEDGYGSGGGHSTGAKSYASYGSLFGPKSTFPNGDSPNWAKAEADGLATKPKGPPPGAKTHPQVDNNGNPVTVNYPTKHSDPSTWDDPKATATFTPVSPVPGSLNGVAFKPWANVPTTDDGWAAVEGQDTAVDDDFPFEPTQGKSIGAGLIIKEPDGRVWMTRPTNSFGGYINTFPKGTVEHGLSMQASAIKEAFEETGLQVRITGVVGDYERTTSKARFYTAERVGGTPKDMGWESQAIRLAPTSDMRRLVNMPVDHQIIDDLIFEGHIEKAAGKPGGSNATQPRWPAGSPLGGQWKGHDGGGVLQPPKVGSTSNPAATKKAAALYAMAQKGDTAGLVKAASDLNAQVAHQKANGVSNYHSKELAKVSQYATELAAAGAGAPAVKAAAVVAGGVDKLSSYTAAGGKPGGSNPGGMYVDASGQKWLAKGNAQYSNGAVDAKTSDERAHNEVLAAALMDAATPGSGVGMKLVDLEGKHGGEKSGPGSLGVLSKWNAATSAFDEGNPAHIKAAQADFAMHAWLGNYDVLGMGYDNTRIGADGKAVNIDPGGAILFRAQGLKKDKFGKDASEWESMRTNSKEQKKVYGGMTKSALQDSAAKLAAISDDTIKALVEAHGPGDSGAKALLADTLIARKAAIMTKAGLTMDVEVAPGVITMKPAPVPEPPKAAEANPVLSSTGLSSVIEKPNFISFKNKYEAMATEAQLLHASGDLAALQSMPYWPPNTPSGTKMQAYHEALVKDLKDKQAGATAVTGPDGATWAADASGVLQPVAPKGTSALSVKDAASITHATMTAFGPIGWTPGDLENMASKKGSFTVSQLMHLAVTGNTAELQGFKVTTDNLKGVQSALLAAMTAGPTGQSSSSAAVPSTPKAALSAARSAKMDEKGEMADLGIGPEEAATPLPAAPNFSNFNLPDSNTNASSHNAKVAAISDAFDAKNEKAILSLNFGTNTYGKKQASLANDALAALGSVHQVEIGQKANTHPALTGKAKAAVQAEAMATPAPIKPGSKPKPTLADLTPDKLPSPPDMANHNGTGQPFSSKPWKNASNQAAVDAIFAAALKGGMPAVDALTFPELDGNTGTPTGKMVPASLHPSKSVVGPYTTDVANALNDFLNPPKELRPFNTVSVNSVNEAAASFMSTPMFTTVASTAKEHQLGFWVALGNIPDPTVIAPKDTHIYTPTMKLAGKAAYKNYSDTTHKYISAVQSSGSINRAYDEGKTVYGSMDLKKTAKAVYADATPLQAGSVLSRWQNTPAHMLEQLSKAPMGLVFQSGGGMCASMKEAGNNPFAGRNTLMRIVAAPGAKAIHSHGSAEYKSEEEITTLPGQRYVLLERKIPSKGKIEITVLLLPPDPNWVS